jgi:hypothetical protein
VPSQSISLDKHCSNHVSDTCQISKSVCIGCTLIYQDLLEVVAELSPPPP